MAPQLPDMCPKLLDMCKRSELILVLKNPHASAVLMDWVL